MFDAIPLGVLALLRNVSPTQYSTYATSDIFLGKFNIMKERCCNKYIRNLVCASSLPNSRFYWASVFEDIDWTIVWKISNKFCITNKVKEVSFKIIHKIYPVTHLLNKRFKLNIDPKCVFLLLRMKLTLQLYLY